MKPYSFSNTPKNYITKGVFIHQVLDCSIEETCDALWKYKDDLKDFAPDFYKADTKEDFIEKWEDRIKDAKEFMIDAGFCRYVEFNLFRSVILGPDDVKPNLSEPGSCWTDNRASAEFFGKLILDVDDDPNFAVCILDAYVEIEHIDLLGTLILNAIEPSEREIRLYKDAKFEEIEYEVL